MRLERTVTELSSDGGLVVGLRDPIEVRLRYGTWDAGLPIYRWAGGHWDDEFLDPGIPLLSAANDTAPDEPVHRFVARIPRKIRGQASSYLLYQTTLLQWVARSPAAADLFEQAPTLLWLLVAIASEDQWSRKKIGRLLSQRRIEILRQITGTRSEAAVRLLNRVALRNGDFTEYRLLKTFLCEEALWRGLSQWATIPVHIPAVLLRFPELSGSRLLRQIANGHYSGIADAVAQVRRTVTAWRDVLRMGPLLDVDDARQALARCTTCEAIAGLHDRWVERLNRRHHLPVAGQRTFPAPPIAGNDAIQPILSEEGLLEEGRLMCHCVASYADRVRSGESYIYRLLHPERATLEIRLRGPVPVIAQFKLARNRDPSPESWHTVHQWLAECSGR